MHRLVRPQMHSRHREGGASTLLFSFASLELRLSEPVESAAPTESSYPQGHRTHKNEHSAAAARHIERGSGQLYPQLSYSYTHIAHRYINRAIRSRGPLPIPSQSVVIIRLLGYNVNIVFMSSTHRCLCNDVSDHRERGFYATSLEIHPYRRL